MKICFITNGVISKHATMKRAFGLGRNLVKHGDSVDIVMEGSSVNSEWLARTDGCRGLIYTDLRNPIRARRLKERIVAAGEYDVVHICGLGWRNSVRRSKLPNVSLCVMDHVELESAFTNASWIRRLRSRHLERWAIREYRHHIAASAFLTSVLRYEGLRRGLVRECFYLPYGSEILTPMESVSNVTRITEGGVPRISFLGSIRVNYGIWEMLSAAKILHSRRVSFRFSIAGRGPELAAARRWVAVNALDTVVDFRGYIADAEVADFLSTADVLVAPMHDTLVDWCRCPSKVLSYIATGLPIVSASIGEIREYLGDNCFSYEPSSPASMADALERAIAAAAPDHTRYDASRYSWDALTRRYRNWLETELKTCIPRNRGDE